MIPSGTNRDIERKNHFVDAFLSEAVKRVGTGFDHFGGYAALIGADYVCALVEPVSDKVNAVSFIELRS